MQNLEALINGILQDPLAAARASDRPVGVVGLDLPPDIRFASQRQFCHLPWNKQQATPNADKWLESSFPGWARSILEDWLAGTFDFFDSVIFTRGDDASQRLYYYLCELQAQGRTGGPQPLIFDVAAIPRRTSIRHCANAITRLMAALEIDGKDLERGITTANEYRQFYAHLDMHRVAPGFIYENIARADLFSNLLPALAGVELPVYRDYRRLYLAGTPPPDDSLYLAAEACGWNIVGEQHQRSLSRYGIPIDCHARDTVCAVACHVNDSPYGPRAFSDRSTRLLEEVRRTRAEAVVLWLSEDDEATAWHVARQRKALAGSGIPALVMTSRRWDGKDNSIDEMTAFLQELAA